MTNNRIAPKIRFPGFTDAWEQRKLCDVLEVTTRRNGNQFTKEDVLSVSDEFGCVNQIAFQGRSFAGEDISNYKIVDTGDIIYTRSPLRAKPFGIIKIVREETGIVSPLYIVNKATEGNNAEFLYRVFDSPAKTNNYLSPLVRKGAKNTMNISEEEWLSGNVMVSPLYDEQKMIGEFFENLDNTITLHQRKCEELKGLKKGLLLKMFPENGSDYPEIRFPGFIDAWEQRKFGEMVQRVSTSATSTSGLPAVEYEDVIAGEGLLNKDVYVKNVEKKGIAFNGTEVLYGKLRPYLHNWLNPCFKGVAVGDWWVLQSEVLEKGFLYRLIQTNQFDEIANQSAGSKMPRADWNLVSNAEFSVPKTREEQHKIAEMFDELDNTITLHQRKCDSLKELKRGLLQQMFI